MWAYASYATWVLLRTEAKSHGGQIIGIIEFLENFGFIEIIEFIEFISHIQF